MVDPREYESKIGESVHAFTLGRGCC